jgi:hypothetical protein
LGIIKGVLGKWLITFPIVKKHCILLRGWFFDIVGALMGALMPNGDLAVTLPNGVALRNNKLCPHQCFNERRKYVIRNLLVEKACVEVD